MRKIALAFAILAVTYAATPFISLYEIRQDVRHHDVPRLTADIDWVQLREGLKEDIADGITGEPAQATDVSAKPSDDDLPPFGSGFVNNMAGNMVDSTVTPQHLVSTAATFRAAGANPMHVTHAYFSGPTRFVVSVKAGSAAAPTLKVQMDLVRSGFGARWKVTRVWLPVEMLAATEAHSS